MVIRRTVFVAQRHDNFKGKFEEGKELVIKKSGNNWNSSYNNNSNYYGNKSYSNNSSYQKSAKGESKNAKGAGKSGKGEKKSEEKKPDASKA